MSKRSLRISKRRGLSEMVGALFIILILVTSLSFALVMFSSFSGYQSAVDTRAQYDSQLSREALTFNRVLFGASTSYNPAGIVFPDSLSSSKGAVSFPLTNMNFTSSSSGWVFTKKLITGSVGSNGNFLSGNFDPRTTVDSRSGPGEIYTDLYEQQSVGSTLKGVGNWTTQFTLSSAFVSSLGTGTDTAVFSLGDVLYLNTPVVAGSPLVNFYIQDASTPTNTLAITTAFTPTSSQWTKNTYTPSSTAEKTFFKGSSGTYNLIIDTTITLTGNGEQKVYFDDVGVEMQLADTYSAEICPTFSVAEQPLTIQDITLYVDSLYTQPVTQTVSLWDYVQGAMVTVDVASVGTTDVTRFVDLGGLAGGASQIQAFIQTASGSISPAGCPNNPISTSKGTVVMEIYSYATTPGKTYTGTLNAVTLTDYVANQNDVSMELTNSGTSTIHFVSLWIVGSTGPTQFASTLTGTSHFDQWVSPGQTVTFSVTFSWSPGTYFIELVSDKGNIFSENVYIA